MCPRLLYQCRPVYHGHSTYIFQLPPTCIAREVRLVGAIPSPNAQSPRPISFAKKNITTAAAAAAAAAVTATNTTTTGNNTKTSNANPHNALLDDLRHHFSHPSLIPSIAIHDALRKHYPGYSVTRTPASTGLLKFAKAGHARATLDMSVESYGSRAWEIDDHDANHLDSTTDTTPDSYEFSSFGGETGSKDAAEEEEKGVDQGLAKRAGKLKDKIEFGRFVYEWQGNQFLLYVAEYWIGSYDLVRHHYVLFPRSLESEEGREYVGKGSSEVVVDKLIAAAAKYGEKVEDEIWVYDRGYWGKSRRLWEGVRNCRWEDVVLDDGVKERVRGDVEGFFGRREEYNGLGVPWKRGLIFHGLPGNGKTISIKALMRSLASRPKSIPTLYVKSLGKSSDQDDIRSIFDKAREAAPCLLVFEDIDSLVSDHVRSFFLNEVDGLEGNDGILMIGSTNYLDKLDAGISKRPSRFDRKYHFALPAMSERIKYSEYWREKLSKKSSIKMPPQISSAIANITEGFSFAYLQEAFVSALLSILQTETGTQQCVRADDAAFIHTNNTSSTSSPSSSFSSASSLDDNLERNLVWKAIKKQVETLRKEMKESRKSVEDSERNSMLSDAKSKSAVSPGFGLRG